MRYLIRFWMKNLDGESLGRPPNKKNISKGFFQEPVEDNEIPEEMDARIKKMIKKFVENEIIKKNKR